MVIIRLIEQSFKPLYHDSVFFEGTWRKYHGLNDAETYLKECKRVSAEVMNSFPEICSNYDDLFVRLN